MWIVTERVLFLGDLRAPSVTRTPRFTNGKPGGPPELAIRCSPVGLASRPRSTRCQRDGSCRGIS